VRDVIEQFRAAMQSTGLIPPEAIEADGKLRRFASNGKRSDDSGWYLLHGDGIPAGAFGDWRSGVSETWRADMGRKLSQGEETAHRARVEAMQLQREADEVRAHAEVAKRADAILAAATDATTAQPYLVRKGVMAFPGVKVGAWPQRGKVDCLLIPMRDASERLWNVQAIFSERDPELDRDKDFLAGGKKSNCYFAIRGEPAGVLAVCEGYATGASISVATGYPVAVAFDAGNLLAVARSLRAKFPDSRIIILGDNDESGTGQRAAEDAARAVGGMVAIPSEAGKDWNDVHREQGADAVRRGIEAAQPRVDVPASGGNQPADAGTLAHLARLSPIEYDRARKAAAEQLCIRTETLDAEVKRVRGNSDEAVGEEAMFSEREPWPEPVNGEEILDELARTFKRFAILPKHADVALVLWCLSTYLAKIVDVAPILAISSPEKRCGKTTVLSLLKRLVHRALAASNISPAALFRCVEKWGPTLLIDEADTFLQENEELRGIINSGHTRDTAFVIRTVGDEHEPRRFSTWGPKTIALIGSLPDTLADRAVAIELRRKMPSERVEKLRHAGDLEPLARRTLRFATDIADTIRRARPQIPDELHDRAADNWEPLLAIADAAGGRWPKVAREAASVLSGATADGDTTKVELLRDLCALLSGRFAGRSAIGSAELVEGLVEDKAGRWVEFSHGRALTQRQLARLLRPFSIVSGTVRIGAGTVKGYSAADFADAFHRYLPSFDPSQRHNPVSTPVVTDNASVTRDDVLRIADPSQPSIQAGCDGVPDRTPPSGGEEQF
jgi:putative DNA primase/helicase